MFRKNSLVLMYDGTTKQIKDIRAFEKVRVFDYKTMSYDMGVVVGIHKENTKSELIKYVFDDNSVLETTGNTLFLTSYGFNYNNQLQVGDVVYSPRGSKILVRIEKDTIEEEVYELDVEDIDNYVCGNVVVHNATPGYVRSDYFGDFVRLGLGRWFGNCITYNGPGSMFEEVLPIEAGKIFTIFNRSAGSSASAIGSWFLRSVRAKQRITVDNYQNVNWYYPANEWETNDYIEEIGFKEIYQNFPQITTTAPTADNTTGTPILVLLNSAPAQKYEGYIYFVRA